MSRYTAKLLTRASFIIMITIIIVSLLSPTSTAYLYTVGDSSGWNSKGPDYQNWALSHNFYIGDILLFNYNSKFHNVIQVTRRDELEACDSQSPIATYNSGYDMIELKNPGAYFFYCGYGDMCERGQKVEVYVRNSTRKLAPPDWKLPPGTTVCDDTASSDVPPGTKICNAASSSSFMIWLLVLSCAVMAMFCVHRDGSRILLRGF